MSDTKRVGVVERETPEKGKTFLELALGGTAFLTAISGLLFVVGWVYLGKYYDKFGLDLWILDFPAYTPLVYSVESLPALFHLALLILVIFAMGICIALEIPKSKDSKLRMLIWRWSRLITLLGVLVLVLAAVIIMVGASVNLADKQADRTFTFVLTKFISHSLLKN